MGQITRSIFAFLLYLFLQVGLFNHLDIADVAVPFVFLLFLFTLPFSLPRPLVLVIAFATGLLVDVMSSSTVSGLHAFACVLAMYPRERVAALISGSNFRNVTELQFKDQSTPWFVVYLGLLILFHNMAYFFLEAMSFQQFFLTLFKIFSSTLYTFFICMLLTYIFYKK